MVIKMTLETIINDATKEVLQVPRIAEFCKQLHSEPDFSEVLDRMRDQDDDFEVDGVRFIHKDAIDRIQQEELGNDTYMLGCFNADFLSGHIPLSAETIKQLQEKEQFDAIGELALLHLEAIQQEYCGLDGYGHHFNHYDFSEEEIGNYYVFDNRN